MKRFWIDFAVGIFVIIGLISLAFIAFRVGNLSMGKSDGTYTITAEFENIGGVRVGSPIKSAGIIVGNIKSLNLDGKRFKGIMELAIFDKYKFPVDSNASIFTQGLLGEQYVAISPGIETDFFKNGDKVEYTQSAVIIEKLIGQAMLSLTGSKKE